ncbi:MAG TPA: crosslink repair DNA glycosylase YcaQ family protein [Candidatus Sulfotelmatobacter sp.]|nr:crosslink repair DNA glycosylase YcaQ family protein [Candidatus Sulfotelmatobacter sp.]
MSPLKAPSLRQLRRYAIARSLFKATSLPRAIARLGFVQADPMRAPARAQDLILAQRVKDYRAGELERRYPRLPIEEAFFINYGFLPRETLALLHPRGPACAWRAWDAKTQARAQEMLAFVHQHGPTRPKDVQAHFDHGRIKRWGADLNASTHLLEGLHYRGLLRVARRESGTRVYQAIEHTSPDDGPAGNPTENNDARLARAGQLLDMVVHLYAPLPAVSLGYLCRLLRDGVPHLAAEVRQVQEHAKSRYAHAEVDGLVWFWPQGEKPAAARYQVDDRLRFLTPFDPVVWDRRRFQLFWGWEYKMESYVPAHKRRMGHYAMPMLWGEQILGWANLKVVDGRLQHELGFVGSRPRGSAFQIALDEALKQMQEFLELSRPVSERRQ